MKIELGILFVIEKGMLPQGASIKFPDFASFGTVSEVLIENSFRCSDVGNQI